MHSSSNGRLGLGRRVAPAGPPVARPGLDVEDDHDVALARRVEALDDRLAQAGRRPPVDPPDRIAGVYGRTPANRLGSSTRPVRVGRSPFQSWRASSACGRDDPGPDDQGDRHRAVLLADRPPEQVPGGHVDEVEAMDAAMAGDQLDPAGDPAIRRERPAVAQLGPAADPGAGPDDGRRIGRRDQLELGRQGLDHPQPGDRQGIAVADGERRARPGRRRPPGRAASRRITTRPPRPRRG